VNSDPVPDSDPDPGFWWPKNEKNTAEFFLSFLYKNKNLIYLFLGLLNGRPSYKRLGEAFSPQKRTSRTSKKRNGMRLVWIQDCLGS
jgi:hypothetical protein